MPRSPRCPLCSRCKLPHLLRRLGRATSPASPVFRPRCTPRFDRSRSEPVRPSTSRPWRRGCSGALPCRFVAAACRWLARSVLPTPCSSRSCPRSRHRVPSDDPCQCPRPFPQHCFRVDRAERVVHLPDLVLEPPQHPSPLLLHRFISVLPCWISRCLQPTFSVRLAARVIAASLAMATCSRPPPRRFPRFLPV